MEIGLALPGFHHESLFIIEAQLAMGRLLVAIEENATHQVICDARRYAEGIHHRCLRQLTHYEATISALVCGAAAGYLKDLEEAHHWFRTAATIAIQSELEDEIWKSRLNLAQVGIEMGRVEEALLNAGEAARMILKGLTAGRLENRAMRRSLMVLPLAHVVRIAGLETIAESVNAGAARDPRQCLADWNQRPGFRNWAAQQVLHVRRDQYDYFLMN
jgi:hypothetical protein